MENSRASRGPRRKCRTGQLLASMDSRQAALRVESLNAEIARLNLDRAEAEAELDYFNSELSDRIVTAKREGRDGRRTRPTERLEIARKNVERNRALESKSVVAQQRLDDANDRLLEMTERVRELQADMTEVTFVSLNSKVNANERRCLSLGSPLSTVR